MGKSGFRSLFRCTLLSAMILGQLISSCVADGGTEIRDPKPLRRQKQLFAGNGGGRKQSRKRLNRVKNDFRGIQESILDKIPKSKNPEIQIMRKLFKGYNRLVRPSGTNDSITGGGPVVVNTNLLIRTLDDLNVGKMEYKTQITFREQWYDPRLTYKLNDRMEKPFVVIPSKSRLWVPDTFFANEKRAWRHVVDMPNVLVRLYPDGKILYSVRISMDLSCIMDLRKYPFDIQECRIDIASYAYTNDQIDYVWKDRNPVQMTEALRTSIPSFELGNVSTTYCTSTTNTGSYSCLRVVLIFKRRIFYYLAHLYIPSSLLVIVSWVSFWLDRSAVPARVTLGVTTLLTMVTQSNGMNAKLPPVAYVKSIDVWIGFCLLMIFSALIEYGWVIFLPDKRPGPRKRRRSSCNNSDALLVNQHEQPFDTTTLPSTADIISSNKNTTTGTDGKMINNKPEAHEKLPMTLRRIRRRSLCRKICRKLLESPSKSLDIVCRALFPAAFIAFNIYYWKTYY